MRCLAGEEQPLRDWLGQHGPRRRMAGQCMGISAERPAVTTPFGLGNGLRPAAKRRAEKFAQFIERKGGQRPLPFPDQILSIAATEIGLDIRASEWARMVGASRSTVDAAEEMPLDRQLFRLVEIEEGFLCPAQR